MKHLLSILLLLSSISLFGQNSFPDYPDNILDIHCNNNSPIPFHEGKLMYQTGANVNIYSTPVCGDIDDDGVVDIVVARYTTTNDYYLRHFSNAIGVYSGNNLSLQNTISIPEKIYLQYCPYGLVRYPKGDGTMQGAIVAVCCDDKLRSFTRSGQLLNTSDHEVPCHGTPSFCDFNNDGYPEVYIGNAIYDAATLKLLCQGPAEGNKGLCHRGSNPASYPHRTYNAIPFAYNVLGDENLELICGNTIYNVNIVSRSNPALNSVTVNKTITPPNGYPQDGQVVIADFDLDGHVEALVVNDLTYDDTENDIYYYAYKPSTGQILFSFTHYGRGTNYPAVCNIDNDPHPEIIITDYLNNVSNERMYCLRYTPESGLTTIWSTHHNDPSGMTTLAFFDFNLDEIPEIVYRDGYNLNIMDGSNGQVLYSYPMYSGTASEHPIVADVNGDGHAEIIAGGFLDYDYGVNGYGSLTMFGNENWPMARQVWNQYAYNVTNVNNDLSVSHPIFDNATTFTAPDGTIRRPYNNFLQQATYITPTGEPVGTQGEPQLVDIYGELSGQYVWNGTVYTQPGNYTQSFIDINGCDSIVTLHLTFPLDYPDNILEDDCNAPLQGSTWEVHLLYSTPGNPIASYAPVLAGDIDGNGLVDIVTAHYKGNNYRTNTLDIYSGQSLSLQYSFNIQDSIYVSNGPYAIGKYPNANGIPQGAIFVHGYDKKIRSYAIDGTLLNISDRATACDGMVSLADFNGDGYPEVYVGSDIFDAATLKWLCSGPADGNMGLSFRGAAVGVVNHHRCYFAMSLASDVLGDDNQELICGNTIYNVNIVSRTNPSLNSVTINKTVTPPNGCSQDGHVSLADFDLDGECEVLVIRDDTDDHTLGISHFYAYKPSNGQMLFQKSIQCLCTGYPLIGNIDDDPHPEIVFLEKQSYYPMYIYCLRYTTQGGLTTVWQQPHEDTSGQTGITLFDFNQDNIMELVYRDSENLRIINGSGKSHITGNDTICPYNLYARRMAAGTGCEYPIVADVNGDGSAEIVATGLLDQYSNLPGLGGIHVFGNPGGWSPARPVWNQYMYHVTNVNEDLTIPSSCFDKATIFTGSDGTIRRPYNNFLQQACYITTNGEPYNPDGYVEAEHFGQGCENYIYHDVTYDEEGDFEQLIENPLGCDTLMTVHVHLDEQIFTSQTVSTCDSYTWNEITYTESGTYKQTFPSTQGCDSIVILNLTIKSSVPVSSIHGEKLIYYQNYGTYTYSIDPVPGCFGYEWSIDGPWSIDFSPDSPECTVDVNSPGTATLRVRVYTECGYVERTLHINHDARPYIVIYPNPVSDKFNIGLYGMHGDAVILVYNYLGQFIDRFSVETKMEGTLVPYSLVGKAAGVYLISVINNHDKLTKKVVKETPGTHRFPNW